MNKYFNSYRKMISLRGLTDHTIKSYSTYILAYFDFLTDVIHKSPEDVTWDEMRQFVRWLQDTRSLSDRTMNAVISQLRFFTIYVLHKPWDATQLPFRKFDNYLPYVPSQQEVKTFISTIPDLKQKAMVSLMYSSGLRIGEVCHLKYQDIERRNMRIHISHGKNRSDRYALLSKTALEILSQYWFAYDKPVDWLFPKQRDKSQPIDTFYLSRHIHEHERRLGWPERITCHSFRHSPYFHVVFTVPHELNPLIYGNQKLLYSLLHRCSSETLLELARDTKYLGATPGIIQVLHTWGQTLNFHPHIHCIVSGGGLSVDQKLRRCGEKFFIPVRVMAKVFRGKFLCYLQKYYVTGKLVFSSSCAELRNSYSWNEFRDSLYKMDWCPYIKETFNGFGNAIEYLGRYTHRIAITNTRIQSVTETQVSFSARDYKSGETKTVILENKEFIRRFLMHVLPSGFQKIRYYGFLNNRTKTKNLKIIFKLQGYQKFKQRYAGLSIAELLKEVWNYDIHVCPACGCSSMTHLGRSYAYRS